MYLRWFHKHSGRVLTTTKTMVKDLQAHGFDGEVVSWTRGVDREVLKPTQAWPHPNPRPLLLYVGRVSKEKNVEAVCELADEYDVVIIGDGPHRAALEKQYPGAQFLGYKTGSDLANWYSRADVFVFPSQLDTFGIVIIEAMSVGTPVAAYPVPGPQDIIEPGAGYMCHNLRDSVDICLNLNRGRVQQLSEKWTWELCWVIFKENLVSLNRT
jgi:glycosyltransferase involved in cell wall biosynthesis